LDFYTTPLDSPSLDSTWSKVGLINIGSILYFNSSSTFLHVVRHTLSNLATETYTLCVV